MSNDVTAPIKPTSQTAPFRIALGATLGAFVLPIVYPWLCNHCLPIDDALRSKDFFFSTAGQVLPWIIGGGFGGAGVGSVAGRFGKILAQLAPGLVTDATPSGEGIGALFKGAAIGAASDYASDALDSAKAQVEGETG